MDTPCYDMLSVTAKAAGGASSSCLQPGAATR